MAAEPVDAHAPAVFVEVEVAADEVDPASGLAWGAGATGIEEQDLPDGRVRLVVGVPAAGPDALLATLGTRWAARVRRVEAEEWVPLLDTWRDHARAWRVGRLVVEPPWAPLDPAQARPGDVVLAVDPGRAFGSGAHPSTRLALGLLVELLDEQASGAPPIVVDVGCGSGVLAVAAARCGAGRVVAVDIDPEAVRATRENAERNGVADRVRVGLDPVAGLDLGADPGAAAEGAAVVVANVLLPVQRELAPALTRLAGGGPIVLAGFLDAQRDEVVACFPGHGVVADRVEEGWCGLVLGPDGAVGGQPATGWTRRTNVPPAV